MAISLYEHQRKALPNIHNGCILCGGVGSGKSRTSLAYYYTQMGGDLDSVNYTPMKNPLDLYIITTAKKRDSHEWEQELIPFAMHLDELKEKLGNPYGYENHIYIDSWNNIKKYKDVKNAFFIFDEQKVVGYGAWVKAFLKITKSNRWILLSATPGDTWSDYIPVFVANGFYENKTDFCYQHVIWDRFAKYPKIDRYMGLRRLVRLREKVLVEMPVERKTTLHNVSVPCSYDMEKYKLITKKRWNIYEDEPIVNAAELCYIWRKLVNSSEDRQLKFVELIKEHPKTIVFYNFDYELEILKNCIETYNDARSETGLEEYVYSQWNGHAHQDIPEGDLWCYLVQYTAGCEGWNCITTDTIIFYSQNYSYKVLEQASGRINRMNTPFIDLYCYHLKSSAPIDLAIARALKTKKNFNEGKFVEKL